MERKIHFFAMDLPHSDACFVQAYPAETTEAFCDGHVTAFSFFGDVPRSILYDNTKIAVARTAADRRHSSRTNPRLRNWWDHGRASSSRPAAVRASAQPCQVIHYDERGTGLSDRDVPDFSFEAFVREPLGEASGVAN